MSKPKVILVTDGDRAAKEAVEKAAANVGGRCISASAGNPTRLTGKEILNKIKEADHDPVVVMVDDKGVKGKGAGETAMSYLLDSGEIEIMGVVAVSSYGKDCNRIRVDCSLTENGEMIFDAVDKYGRNTHSDRMCGDTLSVLKYRHNLFIVGMGDPGKMNFKDDGLKGAPITTKALKIIQEHAENHRNIKKT